MSKDLCRSPTEVSPLHVVVPAALVIAPYSLTAVVFSTAVIEVVYARLIGLLWSLRCMFHGSSLGVLIGWRSPIDKTREHSTSASVPWSGLAFGQTRSNIRQTLMTFIMDFRLPGLSRTSQPCTRSPHLASENAQASGKSVASSAATEL
jgi:hypothetical protein